MNGCGCETRVPDTSAQRRILWTALVLNGVMFVVGLIAGLIGQSSGLLADAVDMFADAAAYAIAIAAVHRSALFKARSAMLSGSILFVLGAGILMDVVRRDLIGSEPQGLLMVAVASVSLAVNAIVLRMLGKVRGEGIHLSVSWIFTRADVIANLGVIGSGVVVALSGFRFIDLITGAAIGIYVMKEALQILSQATKARARMPIIG